MIFRFFLYQFEVYSSKMIGNFPKILNFSQLYLKLNQFIWNLLVSSPCSLHPIRQHPILNPIFVNPSSYILQLHHELEDVNTQKKTMIFHRSSIISCYMYIYSFFFHLASATKPAKYYCTPINEPTTISSLLLLLWHGLLLSPLNI